MRAVAEGQPGSWTVGGEQAGQPEYHPLEIVRGPEGALWSAWRPSWQDLWRILRGCPVRVGILAERQPPILVKVTATAEEDQPA